MSLPFLLMGAQAGGNLADIYTSSKQIGMLKRAADMDAQQLDLRMQQERLASAEQSLFQLDQLAETLASQRAIMAARGVLPGVGSALAIEQKSIQAFNRDEQARALSIGFMQAQVESQKVAGKLSAAGQAAGIGAGLMSRMASQIPVSEFGSKDGGAAGLKGGASAAKGPRKSGAMK